MVNKTMTPIEKAINSVGNANKLAGLLGVTPQNINNIKKRGGSIPTRKVSADEWSNKTGLPKSVLFPEYYS